MTKKECTVSESLYGLYFSVLFGCKALGMHEGIFIYKYLLLLGIVLYALKELFTEKTVGEHLVSICLLLISFASYLNSGEKGFLLYITMMLGMKAVSTRFVHTIALRILVVSYPLMMIFSKCGLLKKTVVSGNYRIGMGLVSRQSFGYPGPNVAHTTLIILFALFIVLRENYTKKQLITFVVYLFSFSIYVYMYTVSYTGMIGCFLLLILYIYFQSKQRINLFEKWGCFLLYPFLCAISVGVPLLVSDGVLWRLDKIFHNRMNYSRFFLTSLPIKLWGNSLGETPLADYYIDSAYIYSFLQLGIVPFVVVTGLFIWFMAKCVKENRLSEIAISITFAILGLSDPFLYNLGYKNIMFVWYGEMLYGYFSEVKFANRGILGRNVETFMTKWGKKNVPFYANIEIPLATFVKKIEMWINKNGLMFLLLLWFFFLTSLVSIMFFEGFSKIDGRPDSFEEWDLLRKYMDYSVLVSVFLSCFILRLKKQRIN